MSPPTGHYRLLDIAALSSNSKTLHAVLVLPRGLQHAVDDVDLRRWLSRGRLLLQQEPVEALHRVLAEIGHTGPGDGLASLRLWGQTGERPSTWMMAADPVHLQTLIDHLRLHSLSGQLQLADLRPLFDSLQAKIGGPDCAFARVGGCGYVRGERAIASSPCSPDVVDATSSCPRATAASPITAC